LEKAIEIKRRAQRCLQNGDLDGALSEYEKLTRAEDSEPISFVLMADLLFKKGDPTGASRRYLEAVDAYGKAGLYKNAIAVCKKMLRLALAPTFVLQRLAELHALDGLSTEAALYYQEFAEHQAREEHFREAAESLRRAFQASPESVRGLEKASAWLLEAGDTAGAASVLLEAAGQHEKEGRTSEAGRLRAEAETIQPGVGAACPPPAEPAGPLGPEPETARSGAAEDGAGVVGFETHVPFSAPGHAVLRTIDSARVVVEGVAAEDVAKEAGDVTPPRPAGLCGGPAAEATEAAEAPGPIELTEIEELLRQAADRYKRGEREWAGDALVRAAKAYQALGRLESAAAVYRSLGRSTQTSPEVMGLWLQNCELRRDSREAAEVACILGDHTLNEGDTQGAREWFTRALRHVPDHELAKRRLARLGPRAQKAAAPDGNGSVAPARDSSGRIEVAVGRAQAVTLDLDSLLKEFQQGIEEQLSGDAQSHYDLGVAYREMGLLEQAVERFRVADKDPAFRERCAEMIGRCLLDEGRFDEAVEEFTRALEVTGTTPDAEVSLRFQLGLAHEVAGRAPQALAEFERVYAAQPNFPDVAQKIRNLRRTPESV
jgi:tetratricopeptide (TPR) repeat protein